MNVYGNMTVGAESQVSEVQKVFTRHFPYLRLKFIKADEDKVARMPDLRIASISKQPKQNDNADKIMINALMTVAELETAFYDHFGLQVAVLRKSGNVWLETNFTDSWTLQQQNNMGELIS
ncbi:hypothetical protein BH10BAC2_BH10BAC2_20020 [soil metagenome]